jgi:hypothetical protein
MMFKVWHAKPERASFGMTALTFPDDYRHVADVEAPNMGEVFRLTNHIDESWTENEGVSVPGRVDPRTVRSTSVGDVIQDRNRYYAVAPTGHVLLATLNEWFQTPVPKLYNAEPLPFPTDEVSS